MRVVRLIATFAVLATGAATVAAAPALSLEDLARMGQRLATERCNKPIAVSTKNVRNTFEPEVIDKVVLIRCRAADVSVYIAHTYNPPRELLDYAALRGSDSRVPREVGVGATRQSVLAHLPSPRVSTPEALTYVLNDEGSGENTLVIKFAAGRVRELLWTWHLE